MGLADDLPPLPPPPSKSVLETCSNCNRLSLHVPCKDDLGLTCSECGWHSRTRFAVSSSERPHSREALLLYTQSRRSRPESGLGFVWPIATAFASDTIAQRKFGSKTSLGTSALETVQRHRSEASHAAWDDSRRLIKALEASGVKVAPSVVHRALCIPPDRPDSDARAALPQRPEPPGSKTPLDCGQPDSRRVASASSTRKPKPSMNFFEPPVMPQLHQITKSQPELRREPLSMSRCVEPRDGPGLRAARMEEHARHVLNQLSTQRLNNDVLRVELQGMAKAHQPSRQLDLLRHMSPWDVQ